MASQFALQIIYVPYRPVHSDEEINKDLGPAFATLFKASGLKAVYRGKKYEDRFTQVYLLLWQDQASSHAFITSPLYQHFHTVIQPALNGRRIEWAQHVLVGAKDLSSVEHLKSILKAPVIEVALTKVVEGGVCGYYEQFRGVVAPILDRDPGCDGWFIGPQLENPQDQILLINWKSVDAHHEEYEKLPTFQQCIDALKDYYGQFVVPTHIMGLQLIFGGLPA